MDHILGQLLCYLTLPQDIPCGGSYTATGGQHDTGLHWDTGTLGFFLYFQKPDIDFSVQFLIIIFTFMLLFQFIFFCLFVMNKM